MTLRLWTYPWDILDEGMAAFQATLRQRAGGAGVSVATSYHAGFFLQPASPRRRFYLPEDGTVYYAPDPARWAGKAIAPRAAKLVEQKGDVLAALIRAREAGGAAVHCWTVCLHNMRLAQAHPEAAPENAFGDRYPFALCPSHPAARDYVVTMVREIAERYGPEAIELETPSFMGFAHGYHHEKDGVGLTPEDDFFLSLCFCPACLEGARRAGVDGDAARATARRLVCEAMERAVPAPRFPDFLAAGPAQFAAWPEIADYVAWRREPVASLVAAAREATGGRSRLLLIDFPDSWVLGVDLARIAPVCDGVIYCAYDMSDARTEASMAAIARQLPAGGHLAAGMRLFVPEFSGPEAFASRVAAARAGGAQSINLYNYGLVPRARLDWTRQAVLAPG